MAYLHVSQLNIVLYFIGITPCIDMPYIDYIIVVYYILLTHWYWVNTNTDILTHYYVLIVIST